MEISKRNQSLLLSVEKGFVATVDGKLERNGVVKNTHNKNGYPAFSFRVEKKMKSVMAHRLQGYQKFGETIFVKDIECRHRNNDKKDFSFENILLGTSHMNHMDLPKEERVKRATHASSFMRRFTDGQVKAIVKDHEDGMSYNKLCEKYETSKGTLSYLFNKAAYRQVA